MYLFLAALGLHCCSGSSLIVVSRGYPPAAVASRVGEHRLWGAQGSVLVAPRF